MQYVTVYTTTFRPGDNNAFVVVTKKITNFCILSTAIVHLFSVKISFE